MMVHRPDWRRVRRASGFDTTATRLSHHRDISDILAEAPCTNKRRKLNDFHGLMQSAVSSPPDYTFSQRRASPLPGSQSSLVLRSWGLGDIHPLSSIRRCLCGDERSNTLQTAHAFGSIGARKVSSWGYITTLVRRTGTPALQFSH